MFSPTTYTKRRKTLKKNVGSGIILLLGNEESSINYADNCYRFRQDSTFLYYVGLNKSHMAIILDLDEDREMLFADDPTIDEIIWTGPSSSREELAGKAGIESHRPYEEIEAYLKEKGNGRKVHFLPPYRPGHTLKLQKWLGWAPSKIEAHKSNELIKAIIRQRSYKTEQEVEQIEEAVNITGQMHIEAMRSIRSGMKEYELMSRVHQKALEHDGQLAFPIILTRDGQTLHNHFHGNTVREGDMVLCDAGAENIMGYAGDMTRTFPVSSRFTDIQRRMYNIVLYSKKAAIDALKPGITFKEVHLIACRKMTEGLKEIGLMKGNTEDAVQEGAHAMFFQCGLGHMMGLDVHDMENLGEEYVGYTKDLQKSDQFGLNSLRLGRALETGFVVTVEPGIYIIPELIDRWKAEPKHTSFINYSKLEELRDFGGIRIEDDYLITKEGARLLGNPVPKTIKEIEELR